MDATNEVIQRFEADEISWEDMLSATSSRKTQEPDLALRAAQLYERSRQEDCLYSGASPGKTR